jgi:hypothetical protein
VHSPALGTTGANQWDALNDGMAWHRHMIARCPNGPSSNPWQRGTSAHWSPLHPAPCCSRIIHSPAKQHMHETKTCPLHLRRSSKSEPRVLVGHNSSSRVCAVVSTCGCLQLHVNMRAPASCEHAKACQLCLQRPGQTKASLCSPDAVQPRCHTNPRVCTVATASIRSAGIGV